MKSEEIQELLLAIRGMSISDNKILIALKKIRNDAMATKGGIQRLAKLGCVPKILKVLYHYVWKDEMETAEEKALSEGNVVIALSVVSNLLMDKAVRQQVS